MSRWLVIVGFLLLSAVAQAAPPPVSNHDTKELAALVRQLLLANLPDPLVESNMGWGEQNEVTLGLKWEKKGALRYKPTVMKDVKNDGHWQKVHFHAVEPAKTLTVAVENLRVPAVGKTLFDARIGLDSKIVYEQQQWTAGKCLYTGETRARCRTELICLVEVTDTIETKPGALLPIIGLRVRVLEANLGYKDLVCEHTLGLGGDAAKLIGKAMMEILKTAKPNAEKDLLAKANAAIVKAADTKEVRIELDKLIKRK